MLREACDKQNCAHCERRKRVYRYLCKNIPPDDVYAVLSEIVGNYMSFVTVMDFTPRDGDEEEAQLLLHNILYLCSCIEKDHPLKMGDPGTL